MVCRSLYYIPVITINIPVFWVVTPYSLVHIIPCFGAACGLQFHPSPTNWPIVKTKAALTLWYICT